MTDTHEAQDNRTGRNENTLSFDDRREQEYNRTTAWSHFSKNVTTRSDFGIICPLPTEAYLRSIHPTEHTVSSDTVKTGGKTYRW